MAATMADTIMVVISPLIHILLFYTDAFKPLRNIKRGAGFRRKLIVAYNLNRRVLAVKFQHIAFHCLTQCRCSGVLFFPYIVGINTAGVNNVPAYTVVTCCSVCYFPRIHIGVFVIGDQAFHCSVKMEKVCVTDLFPTTAHRGC